jgi:hypothetical protein
LIQRIVAVDEEQPVTHVTFVVSKKKPWKSYGVKWKKDQGKPPLLTSEFDGSIGQVNSLKSRAMRA